MTNTKLAEALRMAIDRITDLLKGDDGQAFKEAERALPHLASVLDEYVKSLARQQSEPAELEKAHEARRQAQAAQAVPAGMVRCPRCWEMVTVPAAPAPEAKPCLITGTCKHGSWCSEVYCQEHCQFVEAQAAGQELPPHPLPQAEFDALMDHIYEHGTMAEGIKTRALKLCDAYARETLAQRQPLTDAFEAAMRQTWKMIDPLVAAAPPAGTYALGEHNGIAAALMTLRENYERAVRATTGEQR